MKSMKKVLFIAALFPLLVITSSYHTNISERGGGVRGGEGINRSVQDEINRGDLKYRGYGGAGGYYDGGGAVYPVYPVGGYLPPGPVDPGEDEADAIYRANQHPPQ